jgi:peptide deformylase
MEPTAMINPKILKKSKEIKKDWEGCLSIPGIRALVPRPTNIEVEYTDRKGKTQKKKYKDFVARIFQHELDHLDGIVFLDRAKSTDMITEKEYLILMKKNLKK